MLVCCLHFHVSHSRGKGSQGQHPQTSAALRVLHLRAPTHSVPAACREDPSLLGLNLVTMGDGGSWFGEAKHRQAFLVPCAILFFFFFFFAILHLFWGMEGDVRPSCPHTQRCIVSGGTVLFAEAANNQREQHRVAAGCPLVPQHGLGHNETIRSSVSMLTGNSPKTKVAFPSLTNCFLASEDLSD